MRGRPCTRLSRHRRWPAYGLGLDERAQTRRTERFRRARLGRAQEVGLQRLTAQREARLGVLGARIAELLLIRTRGCGSRRWGPPWADLHRTRLHSDQVLDGVLPAE